jgi:hypothetical protein
MTTTEPRVTTPENDARAAAGWKVYAREKTDNRRAKLYSRSVIIEALAPPEPPSDFPGRTTAIDFAALSEALRAHLKAHPGSSEGIIRAVSVGPGWGWERGKREIRASFDLVVKSPKEIPTEHEAEAYAWTVAVPALAPLLNTAGAAARERIRRDRARRQAAVIKRHLVAKIEKEAHATVRVAERLAALVAEAQTEARRLATLALAPGGDASEDELDAFSDGTVIEPEARAYVRRVLVEACAQGAAEVGHPWLPSRDEVTEAEVFQSVEVQP